MTRPNPEESLAMQSRKLVKEIWKKELNQEGKLSFSVNSTLSGKNSRFMKVKNEENKLETEIHMSSFEGYFKATSPEPRASYHKEIKSKLQNII